MDFWDNIKKMAIDYKAKLDQHIFSQRQRITALRDEIDKLTASIDAAKEERRVVISQLDLLSAALVAAEKDPTRLDSFVAAAASIDIGRTSLPDPE